jgi:uncharacterized spore protein YtfJ
MDTAEKGCKEPAGKGVAYGVRLSPMYLMVVVVKRTHPRVAKVFSRKQLPFIATI